MGERERTHYLYPHLTIYTPFSDNFLRKLFMTLWLRDTLFAAEEYNNYN